MSRIFFRTRLSLIMIGVCISIFLQSAHGQFLTSPQPGDIYKEFVKVLKTGNTWRVTHSATSRPEALGFLPNVTNTIAINDLSGAIRAEIVIDRWGGHIGTVGHKFRFNNNAYINIPQLGAANGIPAGHLGECYINQFNPVVAIPLNNLVQGNNTFQGDCGNQTCYGFNWGQWGWFGVIVRVYYNSSKPHPTGSITSHADNAVIGENPVITATTSGSVAQVDFLAYYDGIDYDGDGVFQEYHHSYHRGKTEEVFVIKNHVGSDNSSPYQSTWTTAMVPNQGGIKLKALIKGTDGTFFVTNEVTGLTLQRTGSVIFCKPANVPETFWRRNNQAEKTSNFVIPAGTNLANATSAKLVIATWNGIDGQADPGQTHYMKVNNYTLPNFGADHHYSFDAVTVPINQLVVGTNTFRVFSQSVHHGIEIMWPGPGLILTLSTGGGPVAPSITQHPAHQTVTVGETATFSVQATGTPPLTYRWQKNNVDIGGATNPSYTTPPTLIDDNNSTYRCIVTNSENSATSSAATLTVTPPTGPGITQHPANQSVTVGQTASFTVAANGTQPLTYQWYRNNVLVGGATGASYITPATTLPDSGVQYHCVVTNAINSATSNPAILTVNSAPPPSAGILLNPGFESGTGNWTFYTNGSGNFVVVTPPAAEAGKYARLTVNTVGDNTQFYQSSLPLDANTSYTLSFSAYSTTGRDMAVALQRHDTPFTNYGLNNVLVNLTTGWQLYTIQFTTAGFAGTVNNGRFRFVLNTYPVAGEQYFIDDVVLAKTSTGPVAPSITTHPANQSVPEGATATFNVAATGTAPLTYQWQRNSVDIGGATTPSYTTPVLTPADNGSSYRCIVTNAVNSVTSNPAILTVNSAPPPSAGILLNPGFESGTGNWTFYTNGSGNFVVVTPPAAEAGKYARLTVNTVGDNTQFYQSSLPLDANTSYTLSFSAYSTTGRDMAVALQRHDTPFTNYGLNNVLVNLTTGWQLYTIQFTTAGFAGTVNNGRFRFVLNTYPVAGEQYFIDDVVLAKTSTGPVAPSITTHPANQSVPEGATATFNVAATGTAPLTYQWQRNSVDIGGATTPSYTTPVLTPADNGSSYRCIVTNAVNSVTSNPAILTVNSAPPPSAGILLNPGFESGTGNWTFYTNGSGNFVVVTPPAAEAGKYARLTVNTVGDNTQFYQSSLPLDANTSYTLSFSAYSTTGRDMAVALQRHDTPFTNYGLNNVLVNLTTGWQLYTIQFTTAGFAGTVNNGRFRFVLNTYPVAGEQYFIDDVVLAKTSTGPVAPSITTHPANQSVPEGATATFNVAATGTAPLTYQWQRNSVDIGGATTPSYTTPVLTPADNGSSYRCIVTNAVNSATSNQGILTVTAPPPPGSNWWNNAWTYRLTVTVDAASFERTDKPVEVDLNFTGILQTLGTSAAFNKNSLRVIEVSNAEAVLDTGVAFQFDNGPGYNASTNAVGRLVFMLKGVTPAGGTRKFEVYFDVAGPTFTPPAIPSAVNNLGDVTWEGQSSFRIGTSNATYYYHKQGAGFASMVDANNKDWVSYHPTGDYAGNFRGFPNLGDVFHPGYTGAAGSTSTIENPGPIKLTIRSISNNGLWEGLWEIFPSYARFTVLKMASNYWFLYEGTPGGTFNAATDYVVRSNGMKTPASQLWAGDMTGPEWVYFGDAAMTRTLFAIHHENDSQPEYYRDGSGAMTVFGFGRDNVTCCPRFLNSVPQHFTIGFSPDSAFALASKAINNAYQAVGTAVSNPEVRPAPPVIGGNAVGTGTDEEGLPVEFALEQNFPNPFNPSTTIRYALPSDADATLRLYDVLGQEVATLIDGFHSAGRYEVQVNGLNLASGIYLYRLQAGSFVEIRRLTLIK